MSSTPQFHRLDEKPSGHGRRGQARCLVVVLAALSCCNASDRETLRAAPMSAPTPFKIEIPQTTINKIRERVRAFEWPDAPEGGGWGYGTNLETMKEIAEYWLHGYDWYREQDALNQFPHFKARVRDLDIHFIHLKGSGEKRRPL